MVCNNNWKTSESINIRQAEITDYKAINNLNKNCLGYEFDLEKTKANLRHLLSLSYHRIFVAEIDNQVIGYIHGSEYDSTYNESLKNIMAIAVAPDKQGQGVGRLLLYSIEKWSENTGGIGVRLVSGMNREKAHIFYEHCGYSKRKTQINFIKLF